MTTGPVLGEGRRGAASPLVILAVLVAVAVALWVVLGRGGAERGGAANEEDPTGLVATIDDCRAAGDTLWAEGTLLNAADIPVRNIELRFLWRDSDGGEVASEIVELVGAEGLMVDETTPFRGFTMVEGATDCAAEVFFFEPIT